jgi:Ca-activated chloride channel homolog
MSINALRPFLAVFLIAAFSVSLLPLTYAGQMPVGKSAFGPQSSSGSQRRPEPPPFDRPPLAKSKSDANAPTASAPESSRTQPSGPPVLNRPSASDSRNPSRSSSGQNSTGRDGSGDTDSNSGRERPVLRRPSDSRDQSTQQPRSNTQGDRDDRNQQSNPNQSSGEEDQVLKLESTLVNIPLLVSDRSGRYVPQLNKNDFTLYEDGTLQEIASFGSEEVPFNVALLLDVSPSVQGNVEDIQDAALAFVRQLRSQDRVMVVSFDRSAHFLTDFTGDRRQLEWAIRSVSLGSGTSVYDAVYETVRNKMRGIDGRKAMILFSDGEDTTSSRASYDDAISIVTESDLLVYGLRYPGSGGGGQMNPWPRNPIPNIPFPLPWPWPFPRRRRGPFTLSSGATNMSAPDMTATASAAQSRRRRGQGGDFMADITEAGGGPVYDAERVGDLGRLASKIADELRHVYVLSYYPSNPLSNGGYRSIRIRVKNRDDIAVRHRRGYNARDASSPQH